MGKKSNQKTEVVAFRSVLTKKQIKKLGESIPELNIARIASITDTVNYALIVLSNISNFATPPEEGEEKEGNKEQPP